MALIEAVREGNLPRVRELLEGGVDVDEVDEDGFTALHHAVKRNRLGVVETLTEYRAGVNKLTTLRRCKSPLYLAVEGGYLDIIQHLVRKRADVDKPTASDQFYRENGQTPLHRASYTGRLDIVQYLVGEGANIDAKDSDGWTPLHCASFLGRQDIADFLVNKGANVNMEDNDGSTPLNCASERGNVDTVMHLFGKGANLVKSDKDGLTPLHHAATKGNFGVVRYLLEAGIDVDGTDTDGVTPLHYACRKGHLNIVTHLVENGADVSKGDKDGETCVHHATDGGHLDIIKVLHEKSADLNKKDNNGSTPLHRAASKVHPDILRYFLRKDVPTNTQDNDGKSPIEVASDDGIRKILWRFQKDGVILDDDDISADNFEDDESGGRPTEEERAEVAKKIENSQGFWSFFKEIKLEDKKIAKALPLRETSIAALNILHLWSARTPGKSSEKKKILKNLDGYGLIQSAKGMKLDAVLEQLSRNVSSVTQLLAMSAQLCIEPADVMDQIDEIPKMQSEERRTQLYEASISLLWKWVREGGRRNELLEALQALHLTDAAKAVSSGIQEQPEMADSFSYTAVGNDGGDISLGEGDVQITLPPGALDLPGEESVEVVTIKVPDYMPEIPDDLVEEEEIQASPSVQCTPSGLTFKKPVKITVPHCTSLNKITRKTEVILYTSDESGKYTRNKLKPEEYTIRKDVITVDVHHFSNISVSFKKLAGYKLGFLPFHPVIMPSSRKPILQVYIYHMYKRNEKKICMGFKKLRQSYRQACEALQLIVDSVEDLTVICEDGDQEPVEQNLSCQKMVERKSNKLSFELDFSKQTLRSKNVCISLKQGSSLLEKQIIATELEEPDGQPDAEMSHAYEMPRNDFEKILLQLSEDIDNDFVLKLGIALGFSGAQIKRWENTNKAGAVVTSRGTFYMLRQWIEQTEENDVASQLGGALIQAEMAELAEEYFPSEGSSSPTTGENQQSTGHHTDKQNKEFDTQGDRVQLTRMDSTSELLNRPVWSSMAGSVNKKYRGNYKPSRASSHKK